MKSDRKTRPLTSKSDWKCPIHGCTVIHRTRLKLDERTGREKYAGEYYMCPKYGECKYYVSPGSGNQGPHVAVVE